MTAPIMHLLRVFAGEDGSEGNPLAVFLDGRSIPPGERQDVAAQIGLSETVFVDDPESGAVRIFTPAVELPFAGHPMVGTAWLLAHEGHPPSSLRPPAGEVPARVEGDLAFVAGRPEWGPPYELIELESAAEVDSLDGVPEYELAGAWAWIDEAAGLVRARVFPVALGIEEDEATGGYTVQLCAALGRPITIRQGRGSEIRARPLADGSVEIGGRVLIDERRPWNYEAPRGSP
jgi:predicted PhzF superfamily epimerase YddE/YHI9